jgi:hypothetical protein
MVGNSSDRFIVYGLRETYHLLGEYEFKVVLNPKYFKNSHACFMKLVDGSGMPMKYEITKWGRKINCKFALDDSVSDGVCLASMDLVDSEGKPEQARVTFWCIK